MSGVTKPNIAYLWTEQLRKNGNGNAYGDEANVLRALRTAPELVGIARWNSFANSIEIAREVPWREVTIGEPWTDGDDLDVTVWLQESGAPVRSRNVVADSVARVAKDNSYHPVIDYLGSLTWDGKPRLKTWLSDYLGADADPDYLAAVGAKFLISAVARVYEPGCPTDHVLVLEGR